MGRKNQKTEDYRGVKSSKFRANFNHEKHFFKKFFGLPFKIDLIRGKVTFFGLKPSEKIAFCLSVPLKKI